MIIDVYGYQSLIELISDNHDLVHGISFPVVSISYRVNF